MKGKIVISINGIDEIGVEVKTTSMHKFEKLVLIDSLCESLFLNDEERSVIGFCIAKGGLSKVLGGILDKTVIDLSALKKQNGSLETET